VASTSSADPLSLPPTGLMDRNNFRVARHSGAIPRGVAKAAVAGHLNEYPTIHPFNSPVGFRKPSVREVLGALVCSAEVLSKPFERITVL
jgi:hypothetical protein